MGTNNPHPLEAKQTHNQAEAQIGYLRPGFVAEFGWLDLEPHEEPNNPSPTPPDLNAYSETPYLFISTDSGRESGFMYLDWVIVTYGVPYVVSIS